LQVFDEGMDRATRNIMIVAGEASADRYGARLVERLRMLRSGESLRFFGTGGDAMEKAGVCLLCHIRELAHIGPLEAFGQVRKYIETFRALMRSAQEQPPDLAILLDFPEFNLRLAKRMKRAGFKVIYYISPQLWAWRKGRIRIIREYVDKMLVILPFEEDYYRRRGVDVEFVGHPLLEDFSPDRDRSLFSQRLDLDPSRKTIALLAGSRRKEIDYILPTMLEASIKVLQSMPAQFLISAAPTVEIGHLREIMSRVLRDRSDTSLFRLVSNPSRDILANSDFAFVKSGTSTLEAALVGTPFLIVYKISPLSWYVGRIMIRSSLFGLVNLIAREEIVPEFTQGRAKPEALARVALEYLSAPEKAAGMRSRLSVIRDKLSFSCASDAAAEAVNRYL
jgi:lipid-A-disaccharide synthase